MSEFIWYWTQDNVKVYTRKTEVAEQAMHNGALVMGMRDRPRVFR